MNFFEAKSKIKLFGKNAFKIFYKKRPKEPWQIVAARYCVENSEKGFTNDGLKKYISNIYNISDGHLSQFIEEELQFPLGSKYSRTTRNGYWIPPLELVSKVTDYDELKEARKNAKNAFWLSMVAIIISAVTLMVTAFPGSIEILLCGSLKILCGS